MTQEELLYWLKETDKDKLEKLFSKADEVRKKHVGDDVHLRALVEISNRCSRQCHYCGLRAGNKNVKRYAMSKKEILSCACKAASMGYGTIVMQSGEDFGLDVEWLAEVIREIKQKTPMAVTLSLGERTKDELVLWKNAGADRYLIRFETSNTELFKKLHPPISENNPDRIQILKTLKQIGYEIGSGVMTGIPRQSWNSLARDIELFKELDLDMIGSGPYIAHPDTPLGADFKTLDTDSQVPATVDIAYKVMALTRIMCPDTNIPCTTAVTVLNGEFGFNTGLSCGANVLMPDFTPPEYRVLYQIYPGKGQNKTSAENDAEVRQLIMDSGRTVGTGQGASLNMEKSKPKLWTKALTEIKSTL